MNYTGSLHNHTQMSNFRLRDCIIKEEDLINRAIELGHSVVAITDHETITSAVKISKIKDKLKDLITHSLTKTLWGMYVWYDDRKSDIDSFVEDPFNR